MATELQQIAAALAGDPDAVLALLQIDVDGSLAKRHRVSASLYFTAVQQHLDGPALAAWRQRMMHVSAQYLVLEDSLVQMAELLRPLQVPWVPLKGYDLATRVYEYREERPTSDLDVLIAGDDLERVRECLVAAGWRPWSSGPRSDRYLIEEGYAWQVVSPTGVLVELHFRLWGSVPVGWVEPMMAAATADPAADRTLPPGGHRLSLAEAYVVAAVHLWTCGIPRGASVWRDLAEISSTGKVAAVDIVAIAREGGLQLPVQLAARGSAELFGQPVCRELADALARDLRAAERWVAKSLDVTELPMAKIAWARLLSRRPSRHGWRVLFRRLWVHAGVVEASTPEHRPWWWRRCWYQCVHFGWQGAADSLVRWVGGDSPTGAPNSDTRNSDTPKTDTNTDSRRS